MPAKFLMGTIFILAVAFVSCSKDYQPKTTSIEKTDIITSPVTSNYADPGDDGKKHKDEFGCVVKNGNLQ